MTPHDIPNSRGDADRHSTCLAAGRGCHSPPTGMTKLSNRHARFRAFPLVEPAVERQNPRRFMSLFQHMRRKLAHAIQPVPEIAHSDVADRQREGAMSNCEVLM